MIGLSKALSRFMKLWMKQGFTLSQKTNFRLFQTKIQKFADNSFFLCVCVKKVESSMRG